jgi:mannose-6-phosphate isomerase-like protein (cupin superfamily)
MAETVLRFSEPTGGLPVGGVSVARQPSAYEHYMAREQIPIHRGIGVHNARELELDWWTRRGAYGAFIDLSNTTDLLGIYVIEIPAGASTSMHRQCYEEKFWVLDGTGLAEISLADGSGRQVFAWQQNSLFAIPMNAPYQIVNTGAAPARLVAGNTAPPIINTFDDLDFVFSNRHVFRSRYDGSPDYYQPNTVTLATPELGRAMWRTNLIPDITHCDLPLDNQRSPGYRRIEPAMAGGYFWCFIGEHAIGRYSKAHSHQSGAVLLCVTGEGYTLNWPAQLGLRPWEAGRGSEVERIDYVSGGMVAAAPGGGGWYHQHFGTGPVPLRLLVFHGGAPGSHYSEFFSSQGRSTAWLNVDLEDGGRSISYRSEDPYVRAEYSRVLAASGLTSAMEAEIYQ